MHLTAAKLKSINIALKLIEKAVNEETRAISSQILLELYNVLTRFVANPLPREDI